MLRLLIVLVLISVVYAWEQIDYDIFDLVEDIKSSHPDPAPNFYQVLGLERDATPSAIIKAHRKLSLGVHPDKNPTPEAQAIFTRLGSISGILKDPETRQLYDFYLDNGVPVWKGSGYYYRRHRPGLWSVVGVLVVFLSVVHYGLARLQRWRMVERVKQEMKLRRRKGKKRGGVEEEEVDVEKEIPPVKVTDALVFVLIRWTVTLVLFPFTWMFSRPAQVSPINKKH